MLFFDLFLDRPFTGSVSCFPTLVDFFVLCISILEQAANPGAYARMRARFSDKFGQKNCVNLRENSKATILPVRR